MKFVIVWIVLTGTALTGALAAEETPAEKQVKRGDRFYDRREKGRKWVERAKESYEKALALDSKSVDASWRLARAAYWLGDRTETENEKEKLRLFKQAIDVAKRAISIDDGSAACHFWLGISYAKYGEVRGITESLALIEPIRKEMRRVIEIDESFAGGGAHRALGWIYHKLPGVAGGSNEKAVASLTKAIELDGTHLLNHLCIADIYRKTKRPKLARKHLKIIVDAPFNEERRPEEIEIKAAAKELLAEMGKAEERPDAR